MSEGTESTGVTQGEDRERKWLREVYQGDNAPQLTIRATVLGMLLGGVMSFSNLVIALKTGWSFGVTITAGILAFVLSKGLHRVGVFKKPFTMLENNAMQSVASAAGYMTGGGTAAAIPALMMVNHASLPSHVMFLWITTIAMMGVFMAIPMKRQMINQEGLKFPSGIAAAETLRGLYPDEAAALDRRKVTDVPVGEGVHREAVVKVEGATDAQAAGRWLIIAMGVGALWTWLRSAKASWQFWFNVKDAFEFPFKMHGVALKKWSIYFDTSLLLMAAGGIMGWRSAWSMMLGACANYFLLAPYGHHLAVPAFTEVKYKFIVNWTVWLGSPMLLTSGLLAFAFSWRQVARAFKDLGRLFGAKEETPDELSRVEVPMQWFLTGMMALTPLVALFAWMFFGIAWWLSLLCVVLSFFIAIVASRATGETDITPTGALAKITQIVSGVLAPGSITTNLMTASMGAGVAIHAADLLTDLKSGHLLGARPRQQFLAQFFGVIAGALCVVWAFQQIVPDWTVLGTDRLPAPGAISWRSVAVALSGGFNNLPVSARWLALVGAITGVVLVLIDRALPPKAKKYMPSATGLGLAFTLPFFSAFSMFIGALIALAIEKKYSKEQAERWIIPVSSGIIAGESLMEIVVRVMVNFHILTE